MNSTAETQSITEFELSYDQEQELIGALIYGKVADFDEIKRIVSKADMFDDVRHRLVFSSIERLRSLEYDVSVTAIATDLSHRGSLVKAGGRTYLAELQAIGESCAQPSRLAHEVLDRWYRLQIAETGASIKRSAEDQTKPVETTLAEIDRALTRLTTDAVQRKSIPASELTTEALTFVDNAQKGKLEAERICVGIAGIDRLVNGIYPGELAILGGRTGQGKTTLGMQIAVANAARGINVQVFSLEMPLLQLYLRLCSTDARIDSVDFTTPGRLTADSIDKLVQSTLKIRKLPLYFAEGFDWSVASIRSEARALQKANEIGLVVIDYLQLIRPNPRLENRTQQVTEISRDLKRMALELNVPVLCLSQLSRERPGERDAPKLSDLRDSGSIEQDADIVMLIGPAKNQFVGLSTLHVAKRRSFGKQGEVQLRFLKEFSVFEESYPSY